MEGNGNNPSSVVTLTIQFDQLTGQVQVNGPIANAMLCYGLLEAAKDSIRNYVTAQNSDRRIVTPVGVVPRAK